jgi:hypothetical protein
LFGSIIVLIKIGAGVKTGKSYPLMRQGFDEIKCPRAFSFLFSSNCSSEQAAPFPLMRQVNAKQSPRAFPPVFGELGCGCVRTVRRTGRAFPSPREGALHLPKERR